MGRVKGQGARMVAAAAAIVASLPSATQAQEEERWSWQGQLAPGRVIEVKGVLGSIQALPASGSLIQVVATKRSERGQVQAVGMKVIEHEHGVTICAMYPTPAGVPENECVAGSGGRMGNFNTDVVVDFAIGVPVGVGLSARTAVGDVSATQLTGDVEASTATGNIDISTLGAASARTVGGSIRVSMGTPRPRQDLELITIGGDITLEVAVGFEADVHLKADAGSIETDLPIVVHGQRTAHRLQGRIGGGGANLLASTMGGDIRMRRWRDSTPAPSPGTPRFGVSAMQEELTGTWIAEWREGRVQLSLAGPVFGRWGRTFDESAFRGLSSTEFGWFTSAPVSFRMEQHAGVFVMEGAIREGRGAGDYRFIPRREFADMLNALDIRKDEAVSDRRLMTLAFFSTLSPQEIRELVTLGLPRLSMKQLMDMAIHRVDPAYVRSMHDLGVADANTAAGLVEMRIHGVTAAYVRQLNELGYVDLSAEQLVELAIHGITPGFIHELREAGIRDLPVDRLITMKQQRRRAR